MRTCEDCKGTGWYGDNGPGIKGNEEYNKCECAVGVSNKADEYEKQVWLEHENKLAAKDAEIALLMDKLAKCGFDIGVLTERLAHREKSHAATVKKVIILKKCLSQFVSKFKQYEMDVNAERPIEHRELMAKAAQLIHD